MSAFEEVAALTIVLRARDEAKAVLDRTRESADKTGASLSGMGKAGTIASTAILGAGVAIGGVLIGGGLAAVKLASDFDNAMRQVETQGGITEQQMEALKGQVLGVSNATGVAATELATALMPIAAEGYKGADAINVLNTAAIGSKTYNTDLMTTTMAMTTVMKDYSFAAGQSGHVMDLLGTAVANGRTSFQDLAGSLSTVAPLAANLGVDISGLLGNLVSMTSQGISADTATTNLKFTLTSLIKPTGSAVTALKDMHLSTADLAKALQSGPQGLSTAFDMIVKAAGKEFPGSATQATAAIAAVVGGARGLGAVLATTGAHLKDTEAATAALAHASDGAGYTQDKWANVQKDLGTQLNQFKATVTNLGIQLGEHLVPVLSEVVGAMAARLPTAIDAAGRALAALTRVFQEHQGQILNVVHLGIWAMQAAWTLLVTAWNVALPVLKFLADHFWIVEAAAAALATRLLVLKAIDLISWGQGAVTALGKVVLALRESAAAGTLTSDAFGKVIPNLGSLKKATDEAAAATVAATAATKESAVAATALGGASGTAAAEDKIGALARKMQVSRMEAEMMAPELKTATVATEELGAASSAAGAEAGAMGLGAMGAVGGIVALGAAVFVLTTDAGGLRTELKNFLFGETSASMMHSWATSVIDDMDKTTASMAALGLTVPQVAGQMGSQMSQAFSGLGAGVSGGVQSVADGMTLMLGKVQDGSVSLDRVRQYVTQNLGVSAADWEAIGTKYASSLSTSLVTAAQSGQISYHNALLQMSNDRVLAGIVQNNQGAARDAAAAWDALGRAQIKQDAEMGVQAIASGNAMKQSLAQDATDEYNAFSAAQQKKAGSVDQFVAQYVADHFKAWNDVSPLYQQELDHIHAQAVALGLTDKQAFGYEQTQAGILDKMVAQKQTQDNLNTVTATTRTHTQNINTDLDGASKAAHDMDSVFSASVPVQWSSFVSGMDAAFARVAANAKMAANVIAGVTPRAGKGSLYASAAGRFARAGSNIVTSFAEDEDEWAIPRSKARGHEALLDAMLGLGPWPSDNLGTVRPDSVSAPLRISAPAGGGSGVGGAVTVVIHHETILDGKVIATEMTKHQGRLGRLQGVANGNNR